jgi:hypothetical protein
MADAPTPPLVLSPIVTDYYSLLATLEQDLIARGTWNDLAKSGTGATIMRWIASVGNASLGSVARSLQENYLDTARSPSAVFRAVRLQGGQIIRARAGSINVNVTRTDALATTLTVPAYTPWLVGSQKFFNRVPVVISPTGATVSAVLYRGVINYETWTSDGSPFQRFVLGTRNTWDISNDDLWMTDSTGVLWSPVNTGLWREPGDSTTFFQSTLPDGRVECKFGDGNYAGLLGAGDITFGYVQLDSAINTINPPLKGSTISAFGYSVSGIVDATASANIDAPSPEFYKMIGPGSSANNARAVTRDDYRAIAMQYDGVIDAKFQGQAEINPSDVRWMNVVAASLLTTTPWSALEWLQFKEYMESERAIASTVIVRRDPDAVHINMPITVAAFPAADPTSLQTVVQNVVTDFFAVKAGSLGASYAPSDLILKIMESATYQQAPNETGLLIDTVTVPMDIINLKPTSYFVLDSVTVNVAYTTRRTSMAVLDQIIGV